jgi:GrpB-like predicted nucleotidyltransferase (UPF0157 family)
VNVLGVPYGTVVLSHYTADWEGQFPEERDKLYGSLAAESCRLDHAGSTAVHGLVVKPIIDISQARVGGCPSGDRRAYTRRKEDVISRLLDEG